MTTEQTPDQSDPRHTAEALASALAELEGGALDTISALAPNDASGDVPDAMGHGPVARLAAAARTSLRTIRRGANGVVHRTPGTLQAARDGMRWTVRTLQTLPDSTLRSIAATSLGLGAGLSFTRAGRLAAVVGVVPAVAVEAAIAVRPVAPAQTPAAAE